MSWYSLPPGHSVSFMAEVLQGSWILAQITVQCSNHFTALMFVHLALLCTPFLHAKELARWKHHLATAEKNKLLCGFTEILVVFLLLHKVCYQIKRRG